MFPDRFAIHCCSIAVEDLIIASFEVSFIELSLAGREAVQFKLKEVRMQHIKIDWSDGSGRDL